MVTIVRCDVWSTPSFQNIPENPIKPSFKEAVNDRKMVEMSSSSWNIIRQVSERVVENGGAALVADSGNTRPQRKQRIVIECNNVRQALQVGPM